MTENHSEWKRLLIAVAALPTILGGVIVLKLLLWLESIYTRLKPYARWWI